MSSIILKLAPRHYIDIRMKRYAWQKANKRDCFGVDRSGK
ncbi:Uncharacterised protein [Salmonella enterica subsp. enterica serovar Typhi]|nr:Uncharacterised protein [Salmonella enterica subsp. enterica serovar Typhi]